MPELDIRVNNYHGNQIPSRTVQSEGNWPKAVTYFIYPEEKVNISCKEMATPGGHIFLISGGSLIAHLPNPATQCTATQQPGSSLNRVLSSVNHWSMTSLGGAVPSSYAQSCQKK